MGYTASLPVLILEVVVLCALFPVIAWAYLRTMNLGAPPYAHITTQSVAFDVAKHGKRIHWDKHCLYVYGKPLVLISGEFHYWRLPDRARWEEVLRQYKAGGLNAIRIYFSWTYHSPAEGVYHFDGNRDVDYLMSLCQDIGLWVLAAPGPYICAETQAGGMPWSAFVCLARNCNSNMQSTFRPQAFQRGSWPSGT
jgi:hypothetical protein